DARAANQAIFVLDSPEDRVWIPRHAIKKFFFDVDGRRVAQLDEPGHLEMFEPCRHRGGILDLRRPEPDELALDDRPIHGPKGYSLASAGNGTFRGAAKGPSAGTRGNRAG